MAFSLFLSTLPARGATSWSAGPVISDGFLSTLPARGATEPYTLCMAFSLFLSTLPVRGATSCCLVLVHGIGISIHAPREGSDP